jgi:hypothetical protein
MSQSLRTAALWSLSAVFIASTAFAQPPQRGPRGPGELRPSRQADRLKEGDRAPDFTLKSPDGKQNITLSDFRGKKPVALVFGSYT